jgi:hypothetical protein
VIHQKREWPCIEFWKEAQAWCSTGITLALGLPLACKIS